MARANSPLASINRACGWINDASVQRRWFAAPLRHSDTPTLSWDLRIRPAARVAPHGLERSLSRATAEMVRGAFHRQGFRHRPEGGAFGIHGVALDCTSRAAAP